MPVTVRKVAAGLLAAAAVGGAWTAAPAQNRADTPTNPFAGDPAAAAAGRTAFNGVCAACHGQNGAGSERAPSLNGSLSHGNDDYDIFQVIHDGVPGSQMPSFASLPPNDIWKLVAFIKTSGRQDAAAPATAASSRPGAANTAPIVGDAQAGEALFFGKGGCADCHEINGRGSVVGPDLSAEAGASNLRQHILHPLAQGRAGGGFNSGPAFQFVDVTLKDGRRFNGVVKVHDSAVLDIQSRDGVYHLFTTDQVRSVTSVANGGAPTDVAQRLAPSEIDDIAAYLGQQRKRDFSQTIKAEPPSVLSYDQLAKSRTDPAEWLTYWGDYGGHHFSDLSQITPANVGRLQARWIAHTSGERASESTPIVVGGVMYVTGEPGDVFALDARTGAQLWKFHRNQDKRNPYQINPANRGVAVLGGRVFFNTLDDNLIALDARTGRELWEKSIANTLDSYTMTGAPLALDNMIVVGMSGGEGGVVGFLEAYDPATGKKLWRFDTIPTPGQPGAETWAGDSWKTGGGPTWLTGSYDPELNLIYWTTGNPAPDFNPEQRKGDNLYTDCVIAIDPKTGKMVWYHQFTPNDGHDWDSTEDVILADQMIDGHRRKLMLHADRNGVFYVLDRTNGKFITAKNFVTQTWEDGFDANGRPKVRPGSAPTPQGVRVFPAVGGTNFQAPSYDRRSEVMFLAFQDAEGFPSSAPAKYEPGKLFYGRGDAVATPSRPPIQGVMAWDTVHQKRLWTFPLQRGSLSAGVLGVRGGVVFAATSEGWFYALDEKSGKALWRFNTGGAIASAPISYALDGHQYIALSAGSSVISFALPDSPSPGETH
ncbi:MAG TPA: PQQ-dependent dehydrogenase, methanol/ethanol family [Caulobacteraceae bacterium]|nr:PQQ-dependent dehydrogenase, methanol/ethanol family [Caulobacteraceae bacterium]